MYTVEQAVKIALLENTSVTEDAIKSVVAAVKQLTEPPLDAEDERMLADSEADECGTAFLVDGRFVTSDRVKVITTGADIATISAKPSGPVVGWVIEKVGHPVSFTHYKTVADSQRSMGATVTEHRSRV